MRNLMILCTAMFLTLSGYGQKIMPYYTSPTKIAQLDKGASLDKINAQLGVEPYNIFHMQADGSSLISYKYRLLERRYKYNRAAQLFGAEAQTTGEKWFVKEGTLYVVLLDGKLHSMITDNGIENSVFILKKQNVIQFISANDLTSLDDFKKLFEEGEVYRFKTEEAALEEIVEKKAENVFNSISNDFLRRTASNVDANSTAEAVDPTQADQMEINSEARERELHLQKIERIGVARTGFDFGIGSVASRIDSLWDDDGSLGFYTPFFQLGAEFRISKTSTLGTSFGFFLYDADKTDFFDEADMPAINFSLNYRYWYDLNTPNIYPYAELGVGNWTVAREDEFGNIYAQNKVTINARLGVDLTLARTVGLRLSLGNGPSPAMATLIFKQAYKTMQAYQN